MTDTASSPTHLAHKAPTVAPSSSTPVSRSPAALNPAAVTSTANSSKSLPSSSEPLRKPPSSIPTEIVTPTTTPTVTTTTAATATTTATVAATPEQFARPVISAPITTTVPVPNTIAGLPLRSVPINGTAFKPAPSMAMPAKPATPPRIHAPSHSDPVLPRNSRVRIRGNNRTKWDLIGREGVVRAAQTLGGWHEVELTDGGIVRVQRNALTVLELPPGDGPSSAVRIEAGTISPRDVATATTTSQSTIPRFPRPAAAATAAAAAATTTTTTAQHTSTHTAPLPSSSTPHSHAAHVLNSNNMNRTHAVVSQHVLQSRNGISSGVQFAHPARKRPRPKSIHGIVKARGGVSAKPPHANISKLNLNSLRRYRSVYKLNVANDCSKDELVGAVSRHFQRVTVNENEVISNFLRYLARHGGPPASD